MQQGKLQHHSCHRRNANELLFCCLQIKAETPAAYFGQAATCKTSLAFKLHMQDHNQNVREYVSEKYLNFPRL